MSDAPAGAETAETTFRSTAIATAETDIARSCTDTARSAMEGVSPLGPPPFPFAESPRVWITVARDPTATAITTTETPLPARGMAVSTTEMAASSADLVTSMNGNRHHHVRTADPEYGKHACHVSAATVIRSVDTGERWIATVPRGVARVIRGRAGVGCSASCLQTGMHLDWPRT